MEMNEVLAELAADDANKVKPDVTVHRAEVGYVPPDGLVFPGESTAMLTDEAFGQLCTKIGVSSRYIKKCPPWLQHSNVNYWLGQGRENERFLLRLRSNGIKTVRAVLTPAFLPIDNTPVAQSLAESGMMEGLHVRHLFLSDTKMVLRVTFPDIMETVDGHPVWGGLDIVNSETGAYALAVYAALWQQVCENGMVIALGGGWDLFRQVHRGQDKLLSLGVDFGTAMNNAKPLIRDTLMKFRESTEVVLPTEKMVLEAMRGTVGKNLGEELQETLGPECRVYDFVSALTNRAKDFSLARRNELETEGAALLHRLIA